MVMSSSNNVFSSLYNQGFKAKSRLIFVPNTLFCRTVLRIFKLEGIVLSYSCVNCRFISISINYSGAPFQIYSYVNSKNRYFSYHKLKSAVNSGRFFVVLTSRGYIYSNTAVINKLGGSVVYELKYLFL